MSRFTRWATMILVPVAIPGYDAAAQFNVIGPGSTTAGDAMRGEGAAAFGWGQAAQGWGAGYHLAALGRAVDADTHLRLAAAAARDAAAVRLMRQARIAGRRARLQNASNVRQARLRKSPYDSEITGGDALNALARELTGPSFGLSALRFAPVGVPAGVLERVPLRLARADVVIAVDRLRVAGRWPALLQVPAFAPARRAYDRAIATMFDEAAKNRLTADAIVAVDRSAVGLRRVLEAAARDTPSAEWGRVRAFVIRMERAAKALQDPAGEAAFSDILDRGATSVAGVLELMRRHHLQFDAAQTPDEEERYRVLFARLVQQRDRLTGQDDGVRLGSTVSRPVPDPEVVVVGDAMRGDSERP